MPEIDINGNFIDADPAWRPVPRREPDDATTAMFAKIHENRESFSVENVAKAFSAAINKNAEIRAMLVIAEWLDTHNVSWCDGVPVVKKRTHQYGTHDGNAYAAALRELAEKANAAEKQKTSFSGAV